MWFLIGIVTTNFLINNFTTPVLGEFYGVAVFGVFLLLGGLDYMKSLLNRTQKTS